MRRYLFLFFVLFFSKLLLSQSDSTKLLLISDGWFKGTVSEVHREGFWYRVVGDSQSTKGHLRIIDSARFLISAKNGKTDTFSTEDMPFIYTVNRRQRVFGIVTYSSASAIFAIGSYLLIPEIGGGLAGRGFGFVFVLFSTVGAGTALAIGAIKELNLRNFANSLFGKPMRIIEVPASLRENRFAVWNYLRKKRKGKL